VYICATCSVEINELEARFCPYCGGALSQPTVELGEGTRLAIECGQVVLGEVIGSGGMGQVRRGELSYTPSRALMSQVPHPVAVKLLNAGLVGSERIERFFLDEAEALSRLAHPNIVHFFGLSRHQGRHAIVLELVKGRSLAAVIAEAAEMRASSSLPALPMVPAWRIFSQLLGALAATHALGIVHRDIKPSNILVRADGLVKLTDYGIARLPGRQGVVTGDVAAGTGAYMSPEQITSAQLDGRSDLYAAAIVLYEMLAGSTPFESPERNEVQLRLAHLTEVPTPLTSLLPSAPAVLDVFFARALAKDPQHRHSSAIAMGEALRLALGLPDTSGWAAERRLAEHAVAISRLGTPTAQPTLSEGEAQALRTGVMAAYQC
jgi:serine/threonine protein kinase